ncbi:WXG100 family type VII secretion target [Mycolicibacterium helvum]|uniref:WXG100 family type VII secretion target n=1 Tax=Mycolicibacterium helvum TaxID=1534349 RepID=A0A7I7T2F8_9MYCO|nr:WXG100 family type VII secretion target [Mycolicibacterium helvum]BBY63462.1 hypothetical protein MHEL_17050 [Mycolicibacterium helvum]
MGGVLKVDIEGLAAGSSKVAEQSTALAAAHGQSVSAVTGAQSGWVGFSAQALSSLTDHWNALAGKHTAALDHQATSMDTSAKMFSYMEERNSQKLTAVGEQADASTM